METDCRVGSRAGCCLGIDLNFLINASKDCPSLDGLKLGVNP